MEAKGIVFDIKQMTFHDGPGIRTTVFFKGCPLRCTWCHNPEGISFAREIMVNPVGCHGCDACVIACPDFNDHPGSGGYLKPRCNHVPRCRGCGVCVHVCPLRLRRVIGSSYTANELAAIILKNRELLEGYGGGVTFSGGEPLSQAGFLLEAIRELNGLHTAVETSGYCNPAVFCDVIEAIDLVILDIKLADSTAHKIYTGVDNYLILDNLACLARSGRPFIVRVPLIPSITDTPKNLGGIASLLSDIKGLIKVELLPYHATAGAKYGMVGRKYEPGFDEHELPNVDMSAFEDKDIPCVVL